MLGQTSISIWVTYLKINKKTKYEWKIKIIVPNLIFQREISQCAEMILYKIKEDINYLDPNSMKEDTSEIWNMFCNPRFKGRVSTI